MKKKKENNNSNTFLFHLLSLVDRGPKLVTLFSIAYHHCCKTLLPVVPEVVDLSFPALRWNYYYSCTEFQWGHTRSIHPFWPSAMVALCWLHQQIKNWDSLFYFNPKTHFILKFVNKSTVICSTVCRIVKSIHKKNAVTSLFCFRRNVRDYFHTATLFVCISSLFLCCFKAGDIHTETPSNGLCSDDCTKWNRTVNCCGWCCAVIFMYHVDLYFQAGIQN